MSSKKDEGVSDSIELGLKVAKAIDDVRRDIEKRRDQRRLRDIVKSRIIRTYRKASIASLRSRVEPYLLKMNNELFFSPPKTEDEAIWYLNIITSLELAMEQLDSNDVDLAGSYYRQAKRFHFIACSSNISKPEGNKTKTPSEGNKVPTKVDAENKTLSEVEVKEGNKVPTKVEVKAEDKAVKICRLAKKLNDANLKESVQINNEIQQTLVQMFEAKAEDTDGKKTNDITPESKELIKREAKIQLIRGRDTLKKCDKDVIEMLLLDKDNERVKENVSTSDVSAAMILLDNHEEDLYSRTNSIIVQMILLSIMAFSFSAIIIALFGLVIFTSSLTDVGFVLVLVLLGALGGALSCLKSFSDIKMSDDPEIPVQIISFWLTMIRPLVGAISALALAAFVLSGLVNFGTVSPYQLMVVCFVAGFSERFLLGAVAVVDKK